METGILISIAIFLTLVTLLCSSLDIATVNSVSINQDNFLSDVMTFLFNVHTFQIDGADWFSLLVYILEIAVIIILLSWFKDILGNFLSSLAGIFKGFF